MKRLLIIMLGLLLMSCRSVKSSTETSVKAESTECVDLAISTQTEKYRMQRILEEMFVRYNGYKDITLYDTSLAEKTDKGYEAPVCARIVIRDTLVEERTRVVHDTARLVIHDTITVSEEVHKSIDVSQSVKNDKKPPYDGILSFVILTVIVLVVYKICRRID